MTARDQLVERVALAMTGRSGGWTEQDREPVSTLGPDSHASIMINLVAEVLDHAMPRVATVEELEALHPRAQVLDRLGFVARASSYGMRETVSNGGVLTVVWQPEAGDRS